MILNILNILNSFIDMIDIVVRRPTKTTVNQDHLTRYFKFRTTQSVVSDTKPDPEILQTTSNQIKNFCRRHKAK